MTTSTFKNRRFTAEAQRTQRSAQRNNKPLRNLCVLCASAVNCFYILVLLSLPDCKSHDGFFAALVSFENSCDSSFVHDGHAITFSENLFHIAADHDDRDSALSQLPHQMIDFCFCSHINAARRLIEYQHLRVKRKPFGKHNFLLIAAAQICDLRFNRRRFDVQLAAQSSATLRSA